MRVPRRPVSTRAVIIVTLALAAGFVLVRLALAASLGGFAVAGADFVDPARTPDRLPVTTESGGYDGQFVYRLALAPWTDDRTAYGITLDNPPYRHQRIATPVLAWALGLLPGVSTLLALLLVNVAALAVAAGYAARLAGALGRHPLWGLVLALPAGMPISLGRHLTEPVAWAAVLAGLWYARQRRWPPAAAALTVAVLGRETSLVVVAGLGVAALWRALAPPEPAAAGSLLVATRRDVRALAWLAVPVAVAVGWQLVLAQVWGVLPVRSGGPTNFGGWPVLGVLGSLLDDVPGGAAVTLVVSAERVGVLALVGYAGWALATRRARLPAGEVVAWGLAVAMTLALTAWTSDVQFLRAGNEAIGLTALVALADRTRTGRWALLLAAAMTAGVGLEYALRQ